MESGAPAVLAVQGGDVENDRVLRLMRMTGALVDAQIAELLASKRPARQHPLNRLLNDALGEFPLENHLGRALLDPAGIAGVMVVDLLVALTAGEDHLLGIDDDNVVAIIDMRGEARLVLAAESQRDQ